MAERLFADRPDRMGAYVGASVIALIASRSLSRPAMLRSRRPRFQLLRSVLLFVRRPRTCWPSDSSSCRRRRQLVSHAGLRGSSRGTCAGRKGGRGTHDRNRARISRRRDRDAPGNGRISTDRSPRCRRRCVQFRIRAGHSQARRSGLPQTTLAWTQIAGIVFLTPILPWIWRQAQSALDWLIMAAMGVFAATSHGMLIVAHRFAPAPTLTPFTYTQLIWMIVSGVAGVWSVARRCNPGRSGVGRCLRRLSRCQRAQRTAYRDGCSG